MFAPVLLEWLVVLLLAGADGNDVEALEKDSLLVSIVDDDWSIGCVLASMVCLCLLIGINQ